MFLVGVALGSMLTLIVLYAARLAVQPDGAPVVAAMAGVAMFVLSVLILALALADPEQP